jgi:hypothetical protein
MAARYWPFPGARRYDGAVLPPAPAVNIDEVKALHAQFLSLKGAETPVEGAALSLK